MVTAGVNLDLIPLFFFFFLYSVLEVLIAKTMEDFRFIQIEDDDEEDYEEEYEEEFIPEGIMSPTDLNLIFDAGEVDDDDDEYYEEGEEEGELIPLPRMLPGGSIEDEDYEYEDEDEEDDDYEEEEVEELIPVEMMPRRVSSSISDGRTWRGALVISEGLLNDSESFEGNPGNPENGGGDRGKEEFNKGEIDGLFCPICFEAWTSGGEHQICCLPCGHIYGLSCIKKWLQLRRSSGKCPQCNNLCTLKDVRMLYATRLCVADEELLKRVRSLELYATRLCVADEELLKRVRSLEARCSYLEQKVLSKLDE